MSTIERLNPPSLPADPDRPQVLVARGKRWVFFNGQVGRDKNLKLAGPGLAEQARQVFMNLKNGLDAVGAGGRDVVHYKLYVLNGDEAQFQIALDAGRDVFGADWLDAPGVTMGVACMARPEFNVALEAFAVLA